MARVAKKRRARSGKLRIGDDWNAINIIALSQTNPLKAVAEFVENSIDASAGHITIVRGRHQGDHYLRVTDDGDGIPRDQDGVPNFKYVATHICDSAKRRMKEQGASGIQGEFGIGLLSFWTVGEQLLLTSSGADGKTYQMRMRKGHQHYEVIQRRTLFPDRGTELTVTPLLSGIRHFSGEKIQWYLASELRDRIRRSGVEIDVIDRQARKQFKVEPRQFSGQLLHSISAPETSRGDIYLELYLAEPGEQNHVGLYRAGTRVVSDLSSLEAFTRMPWTSGYLQGIVDAEFLNLTPGTRLGVIQDDAFVEFVEAMRPVAKSVEGIVEAQKKAEEDRASKRMLRTIQNAFREALLALPAEEYDWLDIKHGSALRGRQRGGTTESPEESVQAAGLEVHSREQEEGQRAFFDFPGPLFSVRISPASSIIAVNESRTLRAVPRDRSRKLVDRDVAFQWKIIEGEGILENAAGEILTYHAPAEPGLARIVLTVSQNQITCHAEALVTITDSLLQESIKGSKSGKGLPGYTFERATGGLWRSRYDADKNLIVINNGHRDFVYASRSRALKQRYITRLFAKEIVLGNFPGQESGQLLERLIELSLYAEEHLR